MQGQWGKWANGTRRRGQHSLVLIAVHGPQHAHSDAEQGQQQQAHLRALVEVGQAIAGYPGGEGTWAQAWDHPHTAQCVFPPPNPA